MRAFEACCLGQSAEEGCGVGVVERQVREPSEVEPGGDTRHKAAEPSAAVIEHDGPDHGSSSDSSSAAMPRRPASA